MRQRLACKVSGSIVGLWLLAGEHLRLGSWDLIRRWAGTAGGPFDDRLAMQLVHEAALCVNRIRRKETIAHQGFELLNGLPWVASDEQIHQLLEHVAAHPCFDMILPAAKTKKLSSLFPRLSYQYQWAGFAIATSPFRFTGSSTDLTLLVQRDGERRADYTYKAFITSSSLDPVELVSILYPKRWTIEEFFNFEQAMGWKRASTMNLNIRYGRMSLALNAQAAMYQLRKQLPAPYRSWTAEHLAKTLFNSLDGDIRVRDERIVITIYNAPEELGLPALFSNLPDKLAGEGVNPRMPWLYDFKLDFDFK